MKAPRNSQSILALCLRVAAILCALSALAGIRPALPSSARLLILLFDASSSVGQREIEKGRKAASLAVAALPERSMVSAYAFAGSCREILPPSRRDEALKALTALAIEAEGSEATDLSAALAAARLAASRFPGAAQVLLLSDGRATSGASPSATGSLPIYAVPIGAATGGIRSLGLDMPPSAAAGQVVRARWRLWSDGPAAVEWSASVDGKAADRVRASLNEGENAIDLPIPAGTGGAREILIQAWTAEGEPLPAAEQGGILRVAGPSSVLVVSSAPSPIAAALRAQGFSTSEGGPLSLPDTAQGYAGLSALVLDNQSATELSRAQMEALRAWVSSGGGLLAVGGLSALGRGEYWDTPLEDCLPVETDTRQRRFFNRAQILYVIDHSSSMMDKVGGTSKVMAALQGVARSVQELNPLDEVGIMGFGSEIQWLLPFTPADQRDRITGALSGLADGGGTNMALAFEEIIRTFAVPSPVKRHVILLTDGQTLKADFRSLSSRLKAMGVTLTAIGIGDDVDEKLLSDIAQWNDGRFYRAEDDKIPEIMDKETLRIGRDLIQEGTYRLLRGTASPMTEGLGPDSPPVRGYVITRAKGLASVPLSIAAEAGATDPLLALWRYGAGKAAVFAADSGALWLRDWKGKSEYNRLWAQILRDVSRAPMDGGLRARAVMEGPVARVVVDALDGKGRLKSGAALRGLVADGGSPFTLRETAAGRYEGTAYLSGTGLHQVEVSDPQTGGWTAAWVWLPAGAELARGGADAETLSRLAKESGGTVLDPAGSLALPPLGVRWVATDPSLLLAILSLSLFLAELAWRSLFLGQLTLARAALLNWSERQARAARRIQAAATDRAEEEHSSDHQDAYRRLAESVRESRKRKKIPTEGSVGGSGE